MIKKEVRGVSHLRYEERVVAFVDILGLGALVAKADKDASLRLKIYEALKNVSVVKLRHKSDIGGGLHERKDDLGPGN